MARPVNLPPSRVVAPVPHQKKAGLDVVFSKTLKSARYPILLLQLFSKATFFRRFHRVDGVFGRSGRHPHRLACQPGEQQWPPCRRQHGELPLRRSPDKISFASPFLQPLLPNDPKGQSFPLIWGNRPQYDKGAGQKVHQALSARVYVHLQTDPIFPFWPMQGDVSLFATGFQSFRVKGGNLGHIL